MFYFPPVASGVVAAIATGGSLVVLLVGVAVGALVTAIGCSVWHSRSNATLPEGEGVQGGPPLLKEEAEEPPHIDGAPEGQPLGGKGQPLGGKGAPEGQQPLGGKGQPLGGKGAPEGQPLGGKGVPEGQPLGGKGAPEGQRKGAPEGQRKGAPEGQPLGGDGVPEGQPLGGDGVPEEQPLGGEILADIDAYSLVNPAFLMKDPNT